MRTASLVSWRPEYDCLSEESRLVGLPSRKARLLFERCISRSLCVRAGGSGDDGGKQKEKPQRFSFGDRLTDYIEGGPKLRKWYGAAEQMPRDGALPDGFEGGLNSAAGRGVEEEVKEEVEEEEGPRDAVLVTDADSDNGQMVILSLILKRRRIRALVKDVKAAAAQFGPYVEPVEGDVGDLEVLSKALRGVYAVIITGRVGALPEVMRRRKVDHVILLSQAGASDGGSGGPFSFLSSLLVASGLDAARRDEAALAAAGAPRTVIRTGQLLDSPSGVGVLVAQGDSLRGTLAREDAAALCCATLEAGPPGGGSCRVFEAVNAANGVMEDAELVERVCQLKA